jgi:carboxypeptidase Taq
VLTNLKDTTQNFYKLLKELHHLDGIRALLDWDQQVMIPPAATDARAAQLEVISVIRHQKLLEPTLYSYAKEIQQNTNQDSPHFANASWIIKSCDRERKLPQDFVAKRARLQTECFQVWQKAKDTNEFKLVEPVFAQLLEVYKQETELVGYQDHPYDALLDQYEPEGKVSWVLPLLTDLREKLQPIIKKRTDNSNNQSESIKFELTHQNQHKLGEKIVKLFGLSSDCCRLDSSSHPFCTTIGINDVRITTRYDENNLLSALSSTMHELGHALYEHNQLPEFRGTACGEVYSLGLHESQSRLIENCIGRSKEFCEFLSKILKDDFNKNYSAQDLYIASNKVKKSLIRVDADEVTYSIHVLIRFELEIELLEGRLSLKDLPSRWNQKYQDYLGITPDSDKTGVLQDVHWYSGAFGYFPTYVLGNIYKGTMLKQMQQQIPNMWTDVKNGNFDQIVLWLKTNVHTKGSRYAPRDLVRQLLDNGQLTSNDFLHYLESK